MTEWPGEAGVQVLPLRGTGPSLPVLAGEGSARAVIWPGIGATERSVHLIRLAPASGTVRLAHRGESVYYVLNGSGTVAGDDLAAATPLIPGSMVHISPGTGYRFVAGAGGLEIFGGPCPHDPALYAGADGADDEHGGAGSPHGADGAQREPGGAPGAQAGGPAGPAIKVLHQDEPALMLPLISADARMIVWPGIGAWTATMNYVRMQPGEENSPHSHQGSEDTIVILEGRGSIDDLTHGQTHEFGAGDVIHVPAGLRHAVRANRGENVVSVGGPCPADLPFLRRCGADIPERDEPVPSPPRSHGVP
jgi:quercetin dioxygenase-like cupin family protein